MSGDGVWYIITSGGISCGISCGGISSRMVYHTVVKGVVTCL